MDRQRRATWLWVLAGGLSLFVADGARADEPVSAEEARETQGMERFLSLLEKNPRRGTALDRVYGYHVERGSLDTLIKRYRDRVDKDPADGLAWLLIGLFESQRGRDAAAVQALRKAEEARPDDALPSYYLGQALVLVGQPDAAAQAFERAIGRKPNRNDLLEIFQALGRVHQRARHDEEALEVWTRLEKLFPDDLRVQEQIASALAEESDAARALPRYESLAKKATDPYRKVQFKMEAAELKVRLGDQAEALKDFEGLLGQLNLDTWLYREVRRKIEEVFLKTDDQVGLAAYYEGWLKTHKEDVEAMARLGRSLANQGRVAAAKEWFDRAVKLAPSRRELRQALIEQLIQEKDFAGAAAQYEAMAKADPNNPDIIRAWGQLLLRDVTEPEAARKKAAADVWRKLVEAKPKDAAIAVQVADLLRQAELPEEAIALYKKAIELAPGSPQYHEYLGEYYHNLKRSDEALAAWSKLAEGSNRNAKNLLRLAEVLAGFGYTKQALGPIAEACQLDADLFEAQLKYADLLVAVEKYDDALARLDLAEKAALDEQQAEGVLDLRIKAYQSADRLGEKIESLKAELDAGKEATAERYRRLARYQEADHKQTEALASINKAVELDPKSVPAWTAYARIHEAGGDLGGAADAYRTLAKLDRRALTEYLTEVAKLEMRLGRRDEALKAGRDLLSAAPGNPEVYQFFSELCTQLGRPDEGLDALRRAVRASPGDTRALLTLGEALAREFRTEEAIELYWRAFDAEREIEAKLGVVSKLTDLYLQRNQFDRLVARLEREGNEAGRSPREATLCLAAAYAASGDNGTARQELERLLAGNPRDTQLLGQLSALAEVEGDAADAAKYQKQLNEIAPSDDGEARLAQLYLRAGEVSEAESIWARMAGGKQDLARILQTVDNLLTHGKPETVLGITERLLREQPSQWDALYREGVALVGLEKPEEAARRFRAILDLKADDDDLSEEAKAAKKKAAGRPAGNRPARQSMQVVQANATENRAQFVWQIRNAARLDGNQNFYNQQGVWTPGDFGQARMGALAWLLGLAQKDGKQDEWVEARRAAKDRAKGDSRVLWDWYYLCAIRQEPKEQYEAARDLAGAADAGPRARWAYLTSLRGRAHQPGQQAYRGNNSDEVDKTPPLPAAELEQVLADYEALRAAKPDWASGTAVAAVMTELNRAKRADDADKIYKALVAEADDVNSLSAAMNQAGDRGDIDTLLALIARSEKLQGGSLTGQGGMASYGSYLSNVMTTRAEKGEFRDVARLFDRYFAWYVTPDAAAHRQKMSNRGAAGNPFGNQLSVNIKIGKNNYRQVVIDFPQPNRFFDGGAITTLRTAYELYKKADLTSDLFALAKKWRDEAAEGDRIYPQLALGYLHWWNDDKDEAVAELTRAAASAHDDPELVLGLAELRAKRDEPDEALALVDSVEPLDQKTMQRRELMALRLAVLSGDVDRARKAAERLFNLRLDTNTQVQLAAQMHQLGMHDLAEAVLARARRRAGNNASTLVGLMGQYQRQNRLDVAVQVAHQILRRSPLRTFRPYQDQDDTARREAIQVLARSGKLKELIARVEAQLKSSPGSMQLLQSLADYHKAAGDNDKARETYERMVALKPDDAKLRYQVGMDLINGSGDPSAALGHLTAALKKDPSLFGYRYWEIQNAFQRAGKEEELATLFGEVDLRAVGNYWAVSEIASNLLRDEKKREQGLKLLRRCWQAYPENRQYILTNFYDDAVWQLPELYDYAREAVIPDANSKNFGAWQGVDNLNSYSSGGHGTGIANRLIAAASKQNKLDALQDEVERALKGKPEWLGGKALLAVIRVKRGKHDEVRPLVQPLLDGNKDAPVPHDTRIFLGQELEDIESLRPLALALYEGANIENDNSGHEFEWHPVRRLIDIYGKAGRKAEARDLVLKFYRRPDPNNYGDLGYSAYRRLNQSISIGNELINLGYPADAVTVFDASLADKDAIAAGRRFYGNSDYLSQRLREGLNRSLRGLDKKTLAPTLRTLLKPDAGPKDGAALNLMVIVHPRELDNAALASLFAEAIARAAKDAELRKEAEASLAELKAEHPGDLSVLVADALLAAQDGPGPLAKAAASLREAADAAPLEDLSEGARPNARQRAEAARRLGLWLVARACWKAEGDDVRRIGDALAALALDAARRQADPIWSLAMLREWGQVALDRGDRDAAERRWTQMLDILLSANNAAHAEPKGGPRAVGNGKAPAAPAVTLDRFELAMGLARLAADKGMNELSFRAARAPLHAGPPVIPIALDANNNNQGMIIQQNNNDENQASQVAQKVQSSLAQLDRTWERRKAPPAEVYAVLRDALMPEDRPGEVFLYAAPLSSNAADPHDVAALAARWAARAGKADDLRGALEARRKTGPLAELPALVALGRLALAEKDGARIEAALAALAEHLKADTLQTSAELACHVAVPALAADPDSKPALALVDRAVANLAAGGGQEPQAGLRLVLAHAHADAGRKAEAKAQVVAYQDVLNRNFPNYGGDYGLYVRKQNLQRFAAEYARAGLWDEVLETLGQFVDAPAYSGGDPALGDVFVRLAKHLAGLPAADRLERLRAWSLPSAGRKSVRLLASFVPDDAPPPAFGTFPSAGFDDGIASTAGMLIAAAREANALDPLADDAAKLAADNVEDADALLILVEAARGHGASQKDRIRAIFDRVKKAVEADKNNNNNNRREPIRWPEILVTRAALRDRALFEEFGKPMTLALIDRTQRSQSWNFLAHLRRDLAVGMAAAADAPDLRPGADPGLARWHAASTASASQHAAGSPPTWWVAHDGLVKHLVGPADDYLIHDVPLTGTFTFSADAYNGGWAEGHTAYGGVVAEPCNTGVTSAVYNVGRADSVQLPSPYIRGDDFNRMTIEVEPGKVRYLVNGHLFYQDDDPSPTAPWLALFCGRERQSVFANARLEGTPEVPAEVRLTHDDRLEGWVSGFYHESTPSRRSLGPDDPRRAELSSAGPKQDYDWSASEGVVYGKQVEAPGKDPVESLLYYFRPLRDGESVAYEFNYEPGDVLVHPSIGRVAFLIEPEGVRLHWITDGRDEWSGLKSDNVADVPAKRRGPAKLPLKAGEWNSATLAVDGNDAVLTLNGTEVYRRPLEPGNPRQFGLFHHKDRTAAQARNVVLRGKWAAGAASPDVVDLSARREGSRADTDASIQARNALIGDGKFQLATDSVLAHARSLPPAERYEFLAKWVFHSTWPSVRAVGRFTPTDAAPPVAAAAADVPYQSSKNRTHTGGQLVAPALELVAAAKELGKLDELADRVDKAPANDDFERRNRLALLSLARAEQGRDADAEAALKQLTELVKAEPPETARWLRWPELVVHWGLAGRPALRNSNRDLAEAMVKHWNDLMAKNIWIDHRQEWGHEVLGTRARADLLAESPAERARRDVDVRLPRWARFELATASTRGQGDPHPRWSVDDDGTIRHQPGHYHDYLGLRVPLRGDFELSGETSRLDYHQTQPVYAGVRSELRWDAKEVRMRTWERNHNNYAIDPPVVQDKEWYPFRLVVKGRAIEFHYNGRKVNEQALPERPDPWLLLHQDVAAVGAIRGLKLAGSPTVPDSLNLTAGADLGGWYAYFDYDRLDGDDPTWKRDGVAVVGRNVGLVGDPPRDQWGNVQGNVYDRSAHPGGRHESLLRYHRPLLEDGRLTYEFLYEPGKAVAHPALDRIAFLLEPDGVAAHWITDGRFDRTGLSPENQAVEPENRRGPASLPLKADDWNRVTLDLKGDTVTLTLNDVVIYERKLEPTNQRTFGLFHFADVTEARVRNVSYKGDWPREIPADLGHVAAPK